MKRSALADEYNNPATFERAATLAWTQAQVQLRHLGIDADEAYLFQELASGILYSDATLRPSSAVLMGNNQGPPGLWRHGISGDLPIVLLRIDDAEDQNIVRQLLRAHEYWRMKQLAVDLVILNEQALLLRAKPPGGFGDPGEGQPVAPPARGTGFVRQRVYSQRRSHFG